MKTRKVPSRMCIGCGEMKPKRDLIRIVRSPEGEISLDATGKKSGRGAYLCKNTACLNAARKGRKLERSFSCKVEQEVYEAMEHELQQLEIHESADDLPESR